MRRRLCDTSGNEDVMTDDPGLLAAAVGPSWDTYYADRFARIEAGESPGQWNWAAALVPFWAAWRKLPWNPLLYVAEYFAVAFAGVGFHRMIESPGTAALLGLLSIGGLAGLVQGKGGTLWARAGARRAVRRARKRSNDPANVRGDLERQAPKRSAGSDLVHAFGSALFIFLSWLAAAVAIGHP
jgi:hypothetical protein